ncbi:alginate lyase family protein [Corynebacterium qintianiae]|uniref:Alginate lyase family protein n=1 Tax=Corynebacterium qintianiae TaxID=2709392 RepID=A0A7T0KL44_9CORY|nr:alginate lyase family protein [Corynebacterium qintianiae]QPK82776.1 alginate lyase family protein [Corynebacterium qintianiae]
MVDIGVAKRQQLGTWWTPKADDLKVAEEIVSGNLTLDPHPSWFFNGEISWNADPFQQQNWRFQLHSMKWLDPLRRVALSDDRFRKQYGDAWYDTVRDWCKHNLETEDDFAWMDMADGLRAITFTLGAALVPESEFEWFTDVIKFHEDRLRDKSRRVSGNHGLHQIQGLFVVASFLGNKQVQEEAVRDLTALFEDEFDAQGTNLEGSLAYHDLNYHWWNLAAQRVQAEGIPCPEVSSRLQTSRGNLAHFVRPDGYLETIGDTPPGRPLSDDDLETTKFARSRGSEGMPPEKKSISLDAGYAAGRSEWGRTPCQFRDSSFYTLRWGTEAIHGHDDASSVTVFSKGVPWIVDPGMFAYQRGKERRYFKGRSAHNLLIAEERDPDATGAVLTGHSSTEDGESYVVTSNAYDGYVLERRVIYLREFDALVISDSARDSKEIDPNSTLNFHQLWHFHPKTEVRVGMRTVTLVNDGAHLSMRWLKRPRFDLVGGVEDPMQGWYSPHYGEKEASSVLEVFPTRRGDQSWLTVISLGEYEIFPIDISEVAGDISLKCEIDDASVKVVSKRTGEFTLAEGQ